MVSLAAVVALVFTAQSLVTAQEQVSLAERGQFDERYSKAVQALSSAEPTARLAAVYSLERLTVESPDRRDVVEAVLVDYLISRAAKGVESDEAVSDLNVAARVVSGTRSARFLPDFMKRKVTIVTVGETDGPAVADTESVDVVRPSWDRMIQIDFDSNKRDYWIVRGTIEI